MTQVLHLSSRWNKFLVSLFISIQSIVPISGRISPHNFELFSISPLQVYSFRCWFSNNSVITFLEACFSSSFVAEVGIFLHSVTAMIYLLFCLPEALWCYCNDCEDRVLFVLIHLTGVSCPPFKFSHLIKFCLLSQLECCLRSFLPLVSFLQ